MARHTDLILGNGIYYSAGGKVRKKLVRKFFVLVLEVAIISGNFSNPILGAFTKLRKAIISSVMSVCMEQVRSHWTEFRKIFLYLYYFTKMYRANSVLIKIWQKITGNLHGTASVV